MSEQVDKDLRYIWHPFTHLKYAERPLNIVSSEGAYYIDEDGRRYIDGISSWWVNIHGHSHPYIAQKVNEQLHKNAHSIFSGFTHPQAIRLAERIAELVPLSATSKKVFFSDDGSTAVEVAVKMALQYYHNRSAKRTRLLAFENSYHGDTFGGMSLAARNAFNNAFSELLFDVTHVPVPFTEDADAILRDFEDELKKGDCAAFIFEPLVQGAGGMIMYSGQVLSKMIDLCRKYGVITIADEVMTGFGRTGKMFASEYLAHRADIMCLSKGLTGGMMPLGLTICSQFVFEAYVQEDKMKTFFHGHSYTANPVACAAANASIDLFEQNNVLHKVSEIAAMHERFANKIKSHAALHNVRSLGSIIAFELKSSEKTGYLNPLAEKISSWFIDKGIILRPLGNIFYILPPYCIKPADLEYIYSQIEEFLDVKK